MLCIISENSNPYFNLAAEEYLLKQFEEDFFLLYRNEPSIIIGKHQNTFAEINYRYVLDHDLKVARRISGGGTVFHDLGNLNFSFFTSGEPGMLVDYKKFTKPIIDVLAQLGVKAAMSEKNDLFVKGKKITGTASHVYKQRVLHHGTLLYSSRMTDLSDALKSVPSNYNDRAVRSTPSKVTNISDHLEKDLDILEFRDLIMDYILNNYTDAKICHLTESDIKEIHRLRITKFSKWDWNFGYSPKYHFEKKMLTQGGELEIKLNVEKGIIKEVKITGDFVDMKDIGEIEQNLAGAIHDPGAIRQKLSSVNVPDYIIGVEGEDLIAAMF